VKTKNFHWHITGHFFRDHQLLLDEQTTEIFAITDTSAKRAGRIGATTIHAIRAIANNQGLKDNNKNDVSAIEDEQRMSRMNAKRGKVEVVLLSSFGTAWSITLRLE
jgi:starvation-inducible DNA-binding protein